MRLHPARGDGVRLAREALAAGGKLLVAVGGDGTASEVIDGMQCAPACGGRGRSSASSPAAPAATCGAPSASRPDVHGAVQALASRNVAVLDLGRIEFAGPGGERQVRHFANVAGHGRLRGRLADGEPRPPSRAPLGQARLHAGQRPGAGHLARPAGALAGRRGRLDEERLTALSVCNGRYFGGGMKVAPDARMDDGLFDVVVWEGFGVTDLVMKRPMLYDGAHVQPSQHPGPARPHGGGGADGRRSASTWTWTARARAPSRRGSASCPGRSACGWGTEPSTGRPRNYHAAMVLAAPRPARRRRPRKATPRVAHEAPPRRAGAPPGRDGRRGEPLQAAGARPSGCGPAGDAVEPGRGPVPAGGRTGRTPRRAVRLAVAAARRGLRALRRAGAAPGGGGAGHLPAAPAASVVLTATEERGLPVRVNAEMARKIVAARSADGHSGCGWSSTSRRRRLRRGSARQAVHAERWSRWSGAGSRATVVLAWGGVAGDRPAVSTAVGARPAVDVGEPIAGPSEARKAVAARRGASWSACYAEELKRDASHRRRGGGGPGERVVVAADSTGSPELAACMERALAPLAGSPGARCPSASSWWLRAR